MKHNVAKKQRNKEIGDLGERVACEYLSRNGFSIVERNYWKKYGELDIVAKRGNTLHFIEVKTVSYETKRDLEWAVTHETWRPEELVHNFKLKQIHKTLQVWLSERAYGGDWQIAVAAVRLVPRETFATVNLLENIVGE